MKKYKDVTRDDLWFCYSKPLSKFLYEEYGVRPITIARNTSSGSVFSLFARSEILQKGIDKYNSRKS